MVKVIFFDWGNLFAKLEGMEESLNDALKPFGFKPGEFRDYWWEAYLLRSLGKIKSDEEMGVFLQSIAKRDVPTDKIIKRLIDNTIIPKEHIDVILKLREKYKVAILSNNVGEWIDRVVKNYNLVGLFDAYIVSSDIGVRKPNGLIYAKALEKMSVLPQESIFVSDEAADDLVTATGLGMKTVLMRVAKSAEDGKEDREILKFYKPDFNIERLGEIIPIIQGLERNEKGN